MIRTAILAGILLVLLSMAYSRPGAMPSFSRTVAPVIEEASAPARAEPMRAEAPTSAPVVEEEVALSEPVAAAPAPPAPVVEDVAPMPAPIEPQRAELPSPMADAGKPVQLLPESMRAAAPEPVRASITPLVADNMPPPPAPQLPAEPAAAPAALPETHVPTRPVMMPRDYASRLTPEGVMPDPAPAPAAIPDARPPVIAAGTKFMTPEERSRELYRLAREMEDTFIRNMTQ